MDVHYIEKIEHKKYSDMLSDFTWILLENKIDKLMFRSPSDFYYDQELITVTGITDGTAIVIPDKQEEAKHMLKFKHFSVNELKDIYHEAKLSLCKESGLDIISYNPRTDSGFEGVKYTFGVTQSNLIIYKSNDESEIIEYLIKYLRACLQK